MKTIKEYTILLSTYHDEIVGKVQFVNADNLPEQSNLYSLPELNNLIHLWKMGGLLGSFAIGTKLANDAFCFLATRG